MTRIAFIGGGNMARALIGGLCGAGTPTGNLCVADPSAGQRAQVRKLGSIAVTRDSAEAATSAEVVVLAVKPQYIKTACDQIRGAVTANRPLVLSVAAGVLCRDLSAWLGGHERVVRVMPNTPALVGRGASGLFASAAVAQVDRDTATAIMTAVGVCVWTADEDGLHNVTALSGSGPAYFFFMMEALENAAIGYGLDPAEAALLCRETAAGAAAMALATDVGLDELRRRVTSPGGTTEAAIRALTGRQFPATVAAAVAAARARSVEMSRENADD